MPDEIALALQDQFAPRITVISPKNRSGFYSRIEITGTLFDDALTAGDSKGTLRYLSVSAGRNPPHNGGIFISSSGSITADPDLGSAGVKYLPNTGVFNLTIDNTIDLRGLTNINITARDISGNSTTETLVLNANTLPYVKILSPSISANRISPDGKVFLSGKIGNSVDYKEAFTEIHTVRFSVTTVNNKGGTVEMKLPDGPGVERTDDGYKKTVPFLSLDERSQAEFRLSDSGLFSCRFDIPEQTSIGQHLTLNVEALNKNNRKSSESITLTVADIGPMVKIFSPLPRKKVYYYTVNNTVYTRLGRKKGLRINAYIGRTYTGAAVKKVAFMLVRSKGPDTSEKAILYEKESSDISGTHEIIIDISKNKYKKFFPRNMAVGAPFRYYNSPIFTPDTAIHITAEDENGNITNIVKKINLDSENPRVSNVEYEYIREADYFIVKFTAYDEETEIDINKTRFTVEDYNKHIKKKSKSPNVDNNYELEIKYFTNPAEEDNTPKDFLQIYDVQGNFSSVLITRHNQSSMEKFCRNNGECRGN